MEWWSVFFRVRKIVFSKCMRVYMLLSSADIWFSFYFYQQSSVGYSLLCISGPFMESSDVGSTYVSVLSVMWYLLSHWCIGGIVLGIIGTNIFTAIMMYLMCETSISQSLPRFLTSLNL